MNFRVSYVHNKPSGIPVLSTLRPPGLQHEVQSEFASELDQAVIPRLCDYQHILDVRFDTSTT